MIFSVLPKLPLCRPLNMFSQQGIPKTTGNLPFKILPWLSIVHDTLHIIDADTARVWKNTKLNLHLDTFKSVCISKQNQFK